MQRVHVIEELVSMAGDSLEVTLCSLGRDPSKHITHISWCLSMIVTDVDKSVSAATALCNMLSGHKERWCHCEHGHIGRDMVKL